MEGHKEVVELLIDKYNLSATDKDDVSWSCIGVYWSYPDAIGCGSLIEWRHCCEFCSKKWSSSCAEADG